MESVFAVLLAPVAAAWFLVTISWWITILYVGLFVWSVFLVNDEDEGTDAAAFFIFLAATFFAVASSHYFGTENSGWDSIKYAFTTVSAGFLYYALWGIASVFVLWIFEALRFKRKYREAKDLYEAESTSPTGRGAISGQTEDKDVAWKRCLSRVDLKNDTPLSARNSEGVRTISSFFFAWPLHLIDKFFGEFIRQIPELLSSIFGRFLDYLTKVFAGEGSGRPDA